MQQEPNHGQQSRIYLAKAYAELDDDLPQASEKAWGAASQIVKAVAEERGWEHHSHRMLQIAVNRLVNETGDHNLRRLFAVANNLHTNFYEIGLDRNYIVASLQDVERFVELMENLLTT